MNEITKCTIDAYKNYLVEEEKCSVTIEKYIRDITAFINWTEGNELTKTLVMKLLITPKRQIKTYLTKYIQKMPIMQFVKLL